MFHKKPGDHTDAADHGSAIDTREERLFRALDADNDNEVQRAEFEKVLSYAGLSPADHRLKQSLDAFEAIEAQERAKAPPVTIHKDQFFQAIRQNIMLIERVLQGDLVIPDFDDFCASVRGMYVMVQQNRNGAPANYIPQLDLQEPEVDAFGVALTTIDGQRFSVGDAQTFFSVQSTCKPVNYCIALEQHGKALVHDHVGHEPSGASFNELTLSKQNLPHNPMINAGAIMTSALIGLPTACSYQDSHNSSNLDARGAKGKRFDYVMDQWTALCGREKPRFNTPVFLSERETADRNYALGYFMREKQAFPEGTSLDDVLEFYMQSCAIEVNAEMMSVLAATLANGGICPVTGERVFATETIQHCLSLMASCGMYDYSGEFAFKIGLPAKSGVSGAVMIVIPNVMGLCTWSPRLDAIGNSIRGLEFCDRLVGEFNFHNFANLTGASAKRDPRQSRIAAKAATVNGLIWAASKGDLGAIEDQRLRGVSLNSADYDMRTPLHLACTENRLEVVEYFIDQHKRTGQSIELSPKDRWGRTPLDDAMSYGNQSIAALLKEAGGEQGQTTNVAHTFAETDASTVKKDSVLTEELIWAAAEGDLQAVKRMVARGVSLNSVDYDLRAPIHLAAAEGQLDVVGYLLLQGADKQVRDRWGHTPLDEARRHNQADVVARLAERSARPQQADESSGYQLAS